MILLISAVIISGLFFFNNFNLAIDFAMFAFADGLKICCGVGGAFV